MSEKKLREALTTACTALRAARAGNCDYQWFCDALKEVEDALSQPSSPQRIAATVVGNEKIDDIIDQVSEAVGMHPGAWDMVRPRELVRSIIAFSRANGDPPHIGLLTFSVEQIESCALAAGFSIEPSTGAIWAVDGYVGTRVDPGLRKFARAILALRPQAVPMTDDQAWHSDTLMAANGIAGFKMDALMRIVRAVEAHHGITAKAEGGSDG